MSTSKKTGKRTSNRPHRKKEGKVPQARSNVIDLSRVRAQRDMRERRAAERFFLSELVQSFVEVSDKDLRPVEMIEASETGCSFRVRYERTDVLNAEVKELSLRVYFTHDTYLKFPMRVINCGPYVENGVRYRRWGCQVDRKALSYPAYRHFVQSMSVYAGQLRTDGRKLVG